MKNNMKKDTPPSTRKAHRRGCPKGSRYVRELKPFRKAIFQGLKDLESITTIAARLGCSLYAVRRYIAERIDPADLPKKVCR